MLVFVEVEVARGISLRTVLLVLIAAAMGVSSMSFSLGSSLAMSSVGLGGGHSPGLLSETVQVSDSVNNVTFLC